MALQPVEAQALFVSRQLKVLKEKTCLQRIKQVLPQGMPEALLLHLNSVNPTRQTIPQRSTLVTHSAVVELGYKHILYVLFH